MTGQVKEELLARPLETGIRVDAGTIHFDPVLLRRRELLDTPQSWDVLGVDLEPAVVDLEPGSLGTTMCQVPIVVAAGNGTPRIEVRYADGTAESIDGDRLPPELSAKVFDRSGEIAGVHASLPVPGDG